MPKIERGRISGLHGMESHTASELREWATTLEARIGDPTSGDEPGWLQRWADRLRRLADQKEKARFQKDRDRA